MDSLECNILRKLKKIPSCEGLNKLFQIKRIQIEFLADAINNDIEVLGLFNRAVEDIFRCTEINIFHNSSPEINEGLLVISNHLGLNKLTKIHPQEVIPLLKVDLEKPLPRLENDDPFIFLLAPLVKALSTEIKDFAQYEVIFVFMELPSTYNKILHSINTVTVKRGSPNQYMVMRGDIVHRINIAHSKNKKPIIVIFPEGGTSGKSNSGEPYSLLPFKNGYKRLAEDFKFDILPIAISVDPDINFYANFGRLLSSSSDVSSDWNDFISLLVTKNAQ